MEIRSVYSRAHDAVIDNQTVGEAKLTLQMWVNDRNVQPSPLPGDSLLWFDDQSATDTLNKFLAADR